MNKWPLFLIIFLFSLNLISAVYVCEDYDDFSNPVLDLNKWEIRQDPEGRPLMDEYWIDSILNNFHTQQNTAEDRRVYLVPNHQFKTGDMVSYDLNVISKEGNWGNLIILTGDQYHRLSSVGYNGGPQSIDDTGLFHVEIEFFEDTLEIRTTRDVGENETHNISLTSPNGIYELYTGSFTGHNGMLHMDFDNFRICEGYVCEEHDFGLDIYTPGYISSNLRNHWGDQCVEFVNGTSYTYGECSGENCFLYEMLCEESNDLIITELKTTFDGVIFAKVNCPNGCKTNACIEPFESAPTNLQIAQANNEEVATILTSEEKLSTKNKLNRDVYQKDKEDVKIKRKNEVIILTVPYTQENSPLKRFFSLIWELF